MRRLPQLTSCLALLALAACDEPGAGAATPALPDAAAGSDHAADGRAPADSDAASADVGPDTSAGDADDDAAAPEPDVVEEIVEPREPRPVPFPTVSSAPGRLVAFGDVHGDIEALRSALRLAGAIDDTDHWIGGDLTVVQVGDQLDRGDDEREILELLAALEDEAWAAGGSIHPLLGNHEIMNVELDLRYVTDGGWQDWADEPFDPDDPTYESWSPEQRGRVAAFRPGATWARYLAEHNVTMVIDGTVFVHGGLLPFMVRYGVEAINEETQAWMRGELVEPGYLWSDDGPVWSRHYSKDTGPAECALLADALELLGVERMVVAHTVHIDGIHPACDGQVWRVDVGMASYYGGTPQVLEIVGGELRVIR